MGASNKEMNLQELSSIEERLKIVTQKLEQSEINLQKEKSNIAKYIKDAAEEHKKTVDIFQTIFNSVQEILVLTNNGKQIIEANDSFLEFFQFKNLNDFKARHNCICELFEKVDKKEYIFLDNNHFTKDNWIQKSINKNFGL